MAYTLGPVKAHVSSAANHFGPKHGIKTIWGFGPGSVAGSDHPKGRALDFMTKNKSTGDALVADLIANATTYNITYIIWWEQIWTPGSGWKPYSGTKNPHKDHVHVSFGATPGTGVPTIPVGNPLVPDAIEEVYEVFKSLAKISTWWMDTNNWKRVGMFSGGFLLCLIAIITWDRVSAGVTKGVTEVGKVVKPSG